mmetsp:Transcript_6104/g.8954  ORF Transcript_6104/g.8954 Transcript_6104/m.8954 type:complete len:448 (-) Transcript_6104:211-1554(-)
MSPPPKKVKLSCSIVALGHHQCGKSTALGHLIYRMGSIDLRAIEGFKKKSKEMGRASYYYAWVMDKHRYERERGMTIEINLFSVIDRGGTHYAFIDVPGSSSYTKNAIAGMALAEVGFLFVSAVPSEFDEGMSKNGQTREHALLAYTMGVKSLVVVVTKMDLVGYSQDRFDEILGTMRTLVKSVGFRIDNEWNKFNCYPISGLNAVDGDKTLINMPWFHGYNHSECLLDFIAETAWERNTDEEKKQPLRVLIEDAYDMNMSIGTVASGYVVSGTMRAGDNVQFSPSGLQAKVASIERWASSWVEATPGEHIGFCVPSLSAKDIHRGMVAFHANNSPAPVVKSFVAQLMIMDVYGGGAIRNGFEFVVHCGTAHVACKLKHISKKLNRRGKVIEEDPESVRVGDACIVTMVPKAPVCMEPFSSCTYLGRLALRDNDMTVGAGIIKSIEK